MLKALEEVRERGLTAEAREYASGTLMALSDKKMHYPRETFGDWFFRRNATHTVEQKCNWGASCNSLCPLFT